MELPLNFYHGVVGLGLFVLQLGALEFLAAIEAEGHLDVAMTTG